MMCGIAAVLNTNHAPYKTYQITLHQLGRGRRGFGYSMSVKDSRKVYTWKKTVSPDKINGKEKQSLQQTTNKFAISHNRMPTGSVTKAQTHPFTSEDDSFALIHNGVISGDSYLRRLLSNVYGHAFEGECDSEVAVHLLEELRKEGYDWIPAMKKLDDTLRGSYAFLVLTGDDALYGLRNRKPITIVQYQGIWYIASRLSAIKNAHDVLKVPYKEKVVKMVPEPHTVFKVNNAIMFNGEYEQERIALEEVSEYGTYRTYMRKVTRNRWGFGTRHVSPSQDNGKDDNTTDTTDTTATDATSGVPTASPEVPASNTPMHMPSAKPYVCKNCKYLSQYDYCQQPGHVTRHFHIDDPGETTCQSFEAIDDIDEEGDGGDTSLSSSLPQGTQEQVVRERSCKKCTMFHENEQRCYEHGAYTDGSYEGEPIPNPGKTTCDAFDPVDQEGCYTCLYYTMGGKCSFPMNSEDFFKIEHPKRILCDEYISYADYVLGDDAKSHDGNDEHGKEDSEEDTKDGDTPLMRTLTDEREGAVVYDPRDHVDDYNENSIICLNCKKALPGHMCYPLTQEKIAAARKYSEKPVTNPSYCDEYDPLKIYSFEVDALRETGMNELWDVKQDDTNGDKDKDNEESGKKSGYERGVDKEYTCGVCKWFVEADQCVRHHKEAYESDPICNDFEEVDMNGSQ